MHTVYRVTIAAAKEKNGFTVTWQNTGTNTSETVEVSASGIVPGGTGKFLQKPGLYLETGRWLFRFLDGETHLLQRAMEDASRRGGPLTLLLCPRDQTADWPFELLASENSFLLPHRLHLVRCVSGWGSANKVPPRDRSLKLLFMACSALDVDSELDFEREEETIFRVTEQLPVDMEVEDSGSLEGLREQLLLEPYDVVHLSGHADIDKEGRPYFIMEDETGYMRKVSPRELWEEALIENPPRLLFLSGCRTGETPETPEALGSEAAVSFSRELVEKYHVPAVLGWGRSVGDEQATHAEQMLYRELSRGKSVTEAVQRARLDLIGNFGDSPFPAWPLLRLFAGGESLDALVTAGQKVKPKTRRMTHVYLQQSRVKVLAEGFVGRRRQLQRSLRALKRDRDKVGVLLLGTGGLGKSCLAGKLCERFKDHTPVIVHGRLNTVTLQAALETAFMVTGDTGGEEILAAEAEMTKKLAKLCAGCFKERNYLLLLDDFEQNLEGADKGEPGALLPEAEGLVGVLLHYLPFSGKETLLMVTSRYGFSLADGAGGGAAVERLESVRLTGFRETEQIKKARELTNILNYRVRSMRMLLLDAGRGNPRLMEWLDVLVGRMAEAEVSGLLEAVKDKREEFIRRHVIRELLQRGGERLAVFMRWFGIYRIPAGLEGARLVGEKAGLAEWKELLALGLDLSLFEHHQAQERYGVTPLLRDELLSGLEEAEVRSCHEAAFDYYKAVCEPMDAIDPILVEEWIYHALARGEEDVASRQGGRLVKFLRLRLAYLESRRVGEWVLSEKKRELSTEHDAFLLNSLAITIYTLGDHRKAVDYYQQALNIYKKVHGEEHQDVAAALNNLGEAWRNLGDPKKAVDYYQQALSIWERVDGENHPQVAIGMNNLGVAWYNLGDKRKAIDYYQQALNIDRAVFGEQHPNVARDLNNLGCAYFDLGQRDTAKGYFEKAHAIFKKFFGDHHPHTKIAAEWLEAC